MIITRISANFIIIQGANNGLTLPQTTPVIPEGFRPTSSVRCPVVTQSNKELYWASIEPNGTIGLYQGGNTVTTAVDNFFINVVYTSYWT